MLLWLAGRTPSLNDVIAESAGASSGWSKYNQTKARWTAQVVLMARVRGLGPVGPGYLTFLFLEPNAKRDPSNILAGGIKILEDGLVSAGIMKNDGWADVLGLVGYWERRPERVGCLVRHSRDGVASKEAMLALLEEELGDGNSNGKNGSRLGNSRHAGLGSDDAKAAK